VIDVSEVLAAAGIERAGARSLCDELFLASSIMLYYKVP
jgi:hypothetical protein